MHTRQGRHRLSEGRLDDRVFLRGSPYERLRRVAVGVAMLALAGTSLHTQPAQATSASSTTSTFFVLRDSFDGEGGAHRYVMPSHLDLRSADSTVALAGLTWSDWGMPVATAVGTVTVCAGQACNTSTTNLRASGLTTDGGQSRYTEVYADNVYGPDAVALPVITSEAIVDLSDTPQVRPRRILLTGNSALADAVTWRTWGSAVATGRGRYVFATCIASCNNPSLRPGHRVSATFAADHLAPCLTGTFWRYTRVIVRYRYRGRSRRKAYALSGCPE